MKRVLFLFCFCLICGALADKSHMDTWRDLNQLHGSLKKLHLSDTQDKAIKSLFKQYHINLKEFWMSRGETDDFVMKLFSQEKLDTSLIQNKLEENYQKKSKIDLKFLENLHSILNSEQRVRISKEFEDDD